jgi:hypothetical protein
MKKEMKKEMKKDKVIKIELDKVINVEKLAGDSSDKNVFRQNHDVKLDDPLTK